MTQTAQDEAPRLGRRTGPSTTREDVLRAARSSFARNGYAGTSIRNLAAEAGVDPALIIRFYKSKDGLFAASLALSGDVKNRIARAFDAPRHLLGESLALSFLSLWEEGPDRKPLMATLRGAASNPYAAEQLARFVQTRLQEVIGRKFGEGEEAAKRAGLAVSMLMGLVLTRNLIAVPMLATLPREEVARSVGGSLQLLLDGA